MAEEKYQVALGVGAFSFYDPTSGINLFPTQPMCKFNFDPTENIKISIKNGRLIDIKGNIKEMIEKEDKGTGVVDTSEIKAKYEKTITDLNAKIKSATEENNKKSLEISKLKSENDKLKQDLEKAKKEK